MSGQPDDNGINELLQRQAARKRGSKKATAKRAAPPPRHPRPPKPANSEDQESAEKAVQISDNVPDESSHEISQEVRHELVDPLPVEPSTTPTEVPTAKHGDGTDAVTGGISREIDRDTLRDSSDEELRPVVGASVPTNIEGMPNLQVDLADPAARVVSPTQLSVRGSIMRRFDAKRNQQPGATHTGLMLDAIRETAPRLPALVLASRPAPLAGDLFPWRPSPEEAPTDDRPEPLRIRPLIGERTVIDDIVTWVNAEVQRQRPRSPKVTRSEVVSVALDESLPQLKKTSKKK